MIKVLDRQCQVNPRPTPFTSKDFIAIRGSRTTRGPLFLLMVNSWCFKASYPLNCVFWLVRIGLWDS